ncbi:hypothetical protein B5807_02713 [Epicoccum nigrum]|uniref:Uncharacterized protein n=1 Tax=Epicoccum nigrum TaxID=105696 RepID=A0A1Y2MA63_EPING|nr:hypothetical protein B5807_02713 [Epicoccum nigrum]
MQTGAHQQGRAKADGSGSKQISPENLPSQSTLSQFVESSQAAFGSSMPRALSQGMNASEGTPKWVLEQVRGILEAASDLYQGDLLILRSLLKLEFSPDMTGFQYLSSEIVRLIRSNLTYAVAFINCVVDAPNNEVSRATKDDVLRDIAQHLGEVSIDMRTHETVEQQLAALNDKMDKEGTQCRPMAKLSPAAFGRFTKHFYGIGLFHPIELMLACLQLEMKRALVLDLHSLYIPFLQELVGLMLMYGIPMTNETYSAFFESVLCNYLDRFVGIESEEKSNAEHDTWAQRANAARIMLETFDHSYFQDILGLRYESNILPAFNKLPLVSPSRGQFYSLQTPSSA